VRIAGLALWLALAMPALAAEGRWSQELEQELMSPYCPGRSLVECPSQKAVELRLWIAGQEDAGIPREDVERQLFERYGDILRHAPKAEGFGLWAYLVPAGALLAGGLVVVGFLRRQAALARVAPTGDPVSRDPDLERQLEEELRS